MNIRRAKITDVPAMGKLINDCAEHGLMLHRSHAYLFERIRDFFVATETEEAGNGEEGSNGADDNEKLVGVCGLSIIWADMAEIYALAVRIEARGQGLGGQLVQACMDEAATLGIRKQMSLTYEQRFFERLGFTVVDRQLLPLKVWSQCVHCAKHDACDEIAMIYVNKDVPELPVPTPQVAERYEVPVTLNIATRLPPGVSRPKMDEAP